MVDIKNCYELIEGKKYKVVFDAKYMGAINEKIRGSVIKFNRFTEDYYNGICAEVEDADRKIYYVRPSVLCNL